MGHFLSSPELGKTKRWMLQAIAKQVMPEKAWAYYSSGADDEITLRENHAAYHRFTPTSHIGNFVSNRFFGRVCRIWFRPRVMRDVTVVDYSTRILGHASTMPIYIVRLNSSDSYVETHSEIS
jgi:L-lactate dehydrogenase (cytochrome)